MCVCVCADVTSWPLDIFLHQRLSHGSVHGSCFNLGVVPPVCPVHFPNKGNVKAPFITAVTTIFVRILVIFYEFHSPSLGVDDNGVRLIDHAGDESFAMAPYT